MTLREAAQQTLEAWDGGDTEWFKRAYTVMENLRAALAEPVQEPQRKPLTEEEIGAAANSARWSEQYHVDYARAIERAHGIGGDA